MKLIVDENDEYKTVAESAPGDDIMKTVYLNGELLNKIEFPEIRFKASL